MTPATLRNLADNLRKHGLETPNEHDVVRHARGCANSTYPILLLAAWLERCPEAILEMGAATTKNPAQTSEPMQQFKPGAYGLNPMPERKGFKVENAEQAAAVLDKLRANQPPPPPERFDVVEALGNRGTVPVRGDDGRELIALVMMGQGGASFPCHFLDKKGGMIMARIVKTNNVVNIPAVAIDPKSRDEVISVLNRFPGARAELNFDPHEGAIDPWEAVPKDPLEGTKPEELPKVAD